MADFNARLKPKRSTVSGEIPSSLDLEVSEIAVNTADGKLFTKHTDGSIKEISGSGGGGSGGSIDKIEDIQNVEARQTTVSGVEWDVQGDPAVGGGYWSYADGKLNLNVLTADGTNIGTIFSEMPTTGTIWISFDDATFTEVAYTNKSQPFPVYIFFELIVSNPDLSEANSIFITFDSPYRDGPSFEGDILKYDATADVWRPTGTGAAISRVQDASDWNQSEIQPGMAMVWDPLSQKWIPGFPQLSTGSIVPGGSETIRPRGEDDLIGPATTSIDPDDPGWTAEGPSGDDATGALSVPVALQTVEYYGQPMPDKIWACTNGSLMWKNIIGGGSGSTGGRSGDFVTESGSLSQDFWLSHWNEDTSMYSATRHRWDGTNWTIRAEYLIPYQATSFCIAVETTFSTTGGIKVVYGPIVGAQAFVIGPTKNGIASNGTALVAGWGVGASGSGDFVWEKTTDIGTGQRTANLLDVSPNAAQENDVLVMSADGEYVPQQIIQEAPVDGGSYVRKDASWVAASTDGGGSAASRVTALAVAVSGELGENYTGHITGLGRAGVFLTVQTDKAAWVRFYTNDAAAAADAGRDQNENPDRGSGVLLELVTEADVVYQITPAVQYFNLDSPTQARLAIGVQNISGTPSPVSLTVDALVLEE